MSKPETQPAVGSMPLFGGARSLGELEQLHLSELVNQIHVIVGDGGKCMCGVYDGQSRTCIEILKRKSTELLNATLIAGMGGQRWGAYHMHPDGWWRLYPPNNIYATGG